MDKAIVTFIASGFLLATPFPTLARPPVSLGVTGGSLGVGPEIAYALNPHFDVRANITFLNFTHGFDSGDLHYDGKADLGSGGIVLDYRPFAGGFFLSAGARYDGNKVRAKATPTNRITINGVTYSPAQIGTFSGYGDFRPVAPTVSLGYSGSLRPGFKIGVEGGAMFIGSARVRSLTYTGIGVAAADVEAERIRLQTEISKYRVYPILQITAAYRFGSPAH